jgi:hypothetical protein
MADGRKMSGPSESTLGRWPASRWDRPEDPERGKYPAYQRHQRAFSEKN